MIRNIVMMATLLLAVALAWAPVSAQQTPESDEERAARLARSGAGIRAGAWRVADLREAQNSTASTWPYFEGYFQRGMDLHLAIESSIGLYRRQEEFEGTDGPLGTAESTTTSYIIPLLTSVKFYPVTRPEAAVGPHIGAGIGVAIAIEDQQGSGGLLQRSPGTAMITGFGAKGGGGLDVRLGSAFGASLGATYQWLRFGSDVGGIATYAGPAFTAGLTYRFRF
jgi:outer membrane protein W